MIAFGALQHIRQPTATARRTARMRRIKRRRTHLLGVDCFPVLSENIQHRLRQMHRPHRGFCFRRADDIVRAERGVLASDAQLACRKVDVIPFQPELFLAVHIRIAHRACADHARLALAAESILQQFNRVAFDRDIFKFVIHPVAVRTAVAVNAAVCAPAIKVHAVFCGQDGFCFNIVHLFEFVIFCIPTYSGSDHEPL